MVTLTVEAADGDLDSSFGSGGKVITDFNGSTNVAYAMALQSVGKLLVAGKLNRPGQVSHFNFCGG